MGPITAETFRHVNNHLTPLAILVVVPGLLVVRLSGFELLLSVALLAYAILTNYLSVALLRGDVQRLAKFRVVSNYVVNVALVLLLYRVWSPIWLVLLLMAVGPALYQTRRDATLTGIAVAAVLLVVQGAFGTYSAVAWADAGVKAFAIVMFSLFVSGLPRVLERG